MDIARNKFSNTICVLFSLVLIGLFCLYTNCRFGLDNMVSCAIMAAVLCALVALLVFFFNRIFNKFCQGKTFNERLIYSVAIIVISLIFVVIRLLMIGNVIKVKMQLGSIYDNAMIGADGKIFVDFSSVEGICSTLISLFISLLGNTYFPIILVQFIISAASYVFLLFGIKKLLGKMASLVVCLGFAVYPVFYTKIASDGIEGMVVFAFSFVIFLSSLYKSKIDDYEGKWYKSLALGLLIGLLCLYHKSMLCLPIVPLIALWDSSSQNTSQKVGNTVSFVIGNVFGVFLPLIIESFVFNSGDIDGFVNSVYSLIGSRFTISINLSNLEALLTTSGVFIIMILCVAYCVLFWKNTDDAGHIIATFLLLLLAQMTCTAIASPIVYIMIAFICLLAIVGYSLSNLGYDPSVSNVYKIEDDMQPAVVAAIGNKVVTSDEEIKHIFAENEEKEREKEKETQNTIDESNTKSQEEMLVGDVKTNIDAQSSIDSSTTEDIHIDNYETDYISPISDTEYSKANSDDGTVLQPASSMTMSGFFSEIKTDVSQEMNVSEDVSQEKNVSKDVSQEKNVSKDVSQGLEEPVFEEKIAPQASDFGMKDADFASLFVATSEPPKFARGSYYDDYYEDTLVSDDSELADDQVVQEEIVFDDVSQPDKEEEFNENTQKQAYVDTFFSYLYDESVFDQPIEMPEPKPAVEEKYVSNAAKFSDLDIDLGTDAFDNVLVDEQENHEEVQSAVNDTTSSSDLFDVVETDSKDEFVFEEYKENITPIVEEFSFDEIDDESSQKVDEILLEEINEESALVTEEFSFEELSFDVSHNDSTQIVEDYVGELFGASQTDIEVSFDALKEDSPKDDTLFDTEEFSYEESLKEKLADEEGFSYEEVITKRLEEEAYDSFAGFSFEEALNKKIDVEESIKDAQDKFSFSYEDNISDKLSIEETIESFDDSLDVSFEELLTKKVEFEETLLESETDADFSIQEAIEQKIDVERDIAKELNKPLIDVIDEYESIDKALMQSNLILDVDSQYNDLGIEQIDNNTLNTITNEDISIENNFESEDYSFEQFVNDDSDSSATNPSIQSDEINDSDKEEIEYIENPLPLPKKHVHREFDYGRSIPENWMHFDVDINSKNDHYDV